MPKEDRLPFQHALAHKMYWYEPKADVHWALESGSCTYSATGFVIEHILSQEPQLCTLELLNLGQQFFSVLTCMPLSWHLSHFAVYYSYFYVNIMLPRRL